MSENAIKKVLHVGCGMRPVELMPAPFRDDGWQEIRFDIDENVNPDILGTITDMQSVPTGAMQAVFSSHNIEHIYPHEVPTALAEFRRVLDAGGFLVITCPDLQSVAQVVAEGRLTQPLYVTPTGPVAAIDILYGLRRSIARGNEFMAHRGGFTLASMIDHLFGAGFKNAVGLRRPSNYDLWVVATKVDVDDEKLRDMLKTFIL